MANNGFERHGEIIAGGDINIFAINDGYQDKEIYEIFYRTCLPDSEIGEENYTTTLCRDINRIVVQKLYLWGFTPRRVKRIMKHATAEYTAEEMEAWRKEPPEVVAAFEDMIKDVTRATATTGYEKALIAAAREIHYNDGAFIWFELDRSIAQKLHAQGVEKEEIKEILQSESFLLENKKYALEMADAIVKQINSLPAVASQAAVAGGVTNVVYNNHYENCTIFLAYNREAEPELRQFIEQVGDIKLVTFEMPAHKAPLAELSAAEPINTGKTAKLEPVELPAPATAPVTAAAETEPVKRPTAQITEESVSQTMPKPTPEPAAPAPAAKPKNGAARKKTKIVSVESSLITEDYNDRLTSIKNYEIVAGISDSTAEHKYKTCAHELFAQKGYWDETVEALAAKKLLDAGMEKLVLQNVMVRYSPAFLGKAEADAKQLAEKIIFAVTEQTDGFNDNSDGFTASEIPEEISKEVFMPVEPETENESGEIDNFYYDAIINFSTGKEYQDLPATEKYLYLAQELLARKGTWQQKNDLEIATVLLNEKIARDVIIAVIAENSPSSPKNRLDYADDLLSKISLTDLDLSSGQDNRARVPKKNLPAPDGRILTGLERIRTAQILDVFFEDMPTGMKYLYYAKPMSKQESWNQDDDIKIGKLLRESGLTDSLIQGAIETYSPICFGISPGEQRAYSEQIVEAVRAG
jgi:hypothetical protein